MRPFILILLLLLIATLARADAPQRIITLAPNLTEIVYTLGEGDRIVAVTNYCLFPPEAAQKTKVGDLFNPSVERAVGLKPDLLLHLPSQEKVARALAASGVKTISVEIETIEDIHAGIETIGAALSVQEKAAALSASIREGLAAMAQPEQENRPRVLFVVGYSPSGLRDIYAAGQGNFIDEMITAAGGRNLLDARLGRYPTVSREFLIANPPDVIVDCNESAGRGRGERERNELRRKWQQFLGGGNSSSVRVVFSDDAHLTIPGPAVVESVAKLSKLIHEEAPHAADSP